MAKREKSSSEGVHKALTHPLRADILLKMQTEGRLSPVTYSKNNGESLNLCAYHFKTLAEHGAIELVDTKPRRGAREHIYAINPNSPVMRFLLASNLSGTASQDSTEEFMRSLTAEKSDNKTALTITPLAVDREGRREVKEILEDTSKRLREAESASRARLKGSGEKPTALQVAMAALRWDPTDGSLKTRGGNH